MRSSLAYGRRRQGRGPALNLSGSRGTKGPRRAAPRPPSSVTATAAAGAGAGREDDAAVGRGSNQ